MGIASYPITPIGVNSAALSPMKPKKITFTPTQAQGWYYKKVSIRLLRPGSTVEETIGTVTYQPTTQKNGGQGSMVVEPKGTLELGQYTKLVLQMDIKNEGCGIGEIATIKNSEVTCTKSTRAVDQKYSLTLRTDNPQTSNHLFVDGKQLPKGVESPLQNFLDCGEISNHA